MFHFRPIAPNAINPEKQISSVPQRGAFVLFRLKNACNESQAAGPKRLER
jgi:hypothetical protein